MVPSLRLGLVKSCRVLGAGILVDVGALLGLLTPDPSLPAQCLAPVEAPLPLGGLNCPTLRSSPSLSQAPATLPSFSKTYFLLLTSQPALTVSQPASYSGRPRTGGQRVEEATRVPSVTWCLLFLTRSWEAPLPSRGNMYLYVIHTCDLSKFPFLSGTLLPHL